MCARRAWRSRRSAVAGVATPARAQVDLEGGWAARQHEDAPERGGGPDVGEYQGLPINDATRIARRQLERIAVDGARASVHSASRRLRPELLAGAHLEGPRSGHAGRSPRTTRRCGWMNPVRTIWMDGRPHPPAHAPHTWQGFSTGQVGRRHADGRRPPTSSPGYLRRNGLARSEKATLLEHFIRNGNVLTWISIVSDPGLPHRAVHQEPQLLLRPRLSDGAVSVLGRHRGANARRARSRTTCQAPIRTSTSSR